jgi:ribosomal-protein-alanine N-acetyltransferase
MTIELVAASEADVAELTLLAAECGLSVDFAAELARSYGRLRVARESAKILGFLLAWRAADELHLTDLGVTAPARRRGVARALIEELCAEGRRSGARVVLLEVRESNHAALALYRALAFEEVYRRARYYADTDEEAVVMRLELG